MKGASAIIAAIILLMVSIALASFVFIYIARTPLQVSAAAEEQTRQFVGDLTPFRVDTIDNGNLYIRNLDVKPIEGEHLTLYVDSKPINITSNNLTPNGVTMINISDGILASGSYDFKLSTRLIEKTETLDVPKNNVVKDPRFGEGGREDFDIVIIIDRSGSMDDKINGTKKITSAKNAANAFVDMTGNQDNISLVSYSTNATLNQKLTFNKTLVKNAINSLSASGWTAIGDAIYNATAELANNGRNTSRKIEVLLTDGEQNRGSDPIQRTNEAAVQGITIYTIGFDTNSAANQLLNQIANITGGRYYFAATGPELNAVFTDIGEEIGLNWIKAGNTDIGVYTSSCSSPGICGKFSGDISGTALYQNVKLVFPGSYNIDASLNVMASSPTYSECASLPGETCAENDARIRLLAFDENQNVIGNVTSPWAGASGLGGTIRVSRAWATPLNTKTVRFQIEPGSCKSTCTVDAVYVDDADMKISK